MYSRGHVCRVKGDVTAGSFSMLVLTHSRQVLCGTWRLQDSTRESAGSTSQQPYCNSEGAGVYALHIDAPISCIGTLVLECQPYKPVALEAHHLDQVQTGRKILDPASV
jgi:hypothetical protein